MSLYRIGDRHPNYRQRYFDGSDLKGLAVYSADSKKVGYVADVLIDESDVIAYLVLSIGSGLATWFGDRKKVTLPANYYAHNKIENRLLVRQLTQADVKALPKYETQQPLDDTYELSLLQQKQILKSKLSSAVEAFAGAASR